jgi:sugar lactone lactonase YvrE
VVTAAEEATVSDEQRSDNATHTVLIQGLGLVESPRWHDGRLWISDWTAGQIITVDEHGGSEMAVAHE